LNSVIVYIIDCPLQAHCIFEFINKCATCAKTKYERKPVKTKFQITPTPERPFENLMIDTLHYEQAFIITIIDTFSKRLYAERVKTCNSNNIFQVITKYLAIFPTPIQISMDQGRQASFAEYLSACKYR
ncbi:hypothetical protein, partial [Klebsiella pneumoniae]|uniref:hypothetical protein n=1 Tax=Klebsiella pneumoniae TaxID=573 RepID=UPI00405566CE